MTTLKDLEIEELVRDLTKTMPIPVAKSYARKRILTLLRTAIETAFEETRGSIDKLSMEDFRTYGDGHYCTHHPDDPSHGNKCYENPAFSEQKSLQDRFLNN